MPYRIEGYLGDIKNQPIYQQLIEYYDYCKFTCNFTTETMKGKISSINHFVRYSNIEDIKRLTNREIFDWMAQQSQAGNKPRTINNRLKHLKAMIKYFREMDDYHIPGVILEKIKKQIEESPSRRAFSREVIYEALHYADRETWLMIKICFDCGLRIHELQQIRMQDINGDQLTIHGKGRKIRHAILSSEVITRLNDYIKHNGITDYLWPSKSSHRVPKSAETIRRKMREIFRSAGVEHFCPHELRHSYATDLKKLNVSTRSIQYGLGHTSEKITEMYLHDLDDSVLRALYEIKYSADSPLLY